MEFKISAAIKTVGAILKFCHESKNDAEKLVAKFFFIENI
jgi:hypothetical protein